MKSSVFAAIVLFASVPAFATVSTVCTGKLGPKGSVTVSVTTASDDNVEGLASIILFSGSPTSMPIHYKFDVVQTNNLDSDSDVSIVYKDKSGRTKILIKVNENPAMGASYIKNLPGINSKVSLSCTQGRPRV